MPPHELSKLLEEQWQSIPLSDKMRYAKLSAIASSRYTANLDDRLYLPFALSPLVAAST